MSYIIDTPVNLLTTEYSRFYNFLINYNVISIGLAFIVSNQVNIVFRDAMATIVSPILGRIFGGREKKLEDLKIRILGMEFQIGKLLFSILNFYIILVILFYLTEFLPVPGSKP